VSIIVEPSPHQATEVLAGQIYHLLKQDILRVLAINPNGITVAELRELLILPPRTMNLVKKIQTMNNDRLLVYARPSSAVEP